MQINKISLHDRLLMAILAPVVFNVAILIVLSTFFRRNHLLENMLARFLLHQAPWPGLLLLLSAFIAPAIAGFMLGSSKFATLLGHFFYTNMEHERNLGKTILLWAMLFGIAYMLSGVIE